LVALILSLGAPFVAVIVFVIGAFGEEGGLIAVAAAILLGSFGTVGLLLAVDGREIRGALEAVAFPIPSLVLVVWQVASSPSDANPSDRRDLITFIALGFIILAAAVEGGYLVARFAARLIGMRTTPKA
jgi:hypothetical protein